jgi:CcmD family protein
MAASRGSTSWVIGINLAIWAVLFYLLRGQDWKIGPGWVLLVNLIIWTGLFLYLLRLDRQLRSLTDSAPPDRSAAGESQP